jgi:hypothetical protein
MMGSRCEPSWPAHMQPTASARSHEADHHDRATPLQSALRRSIDIYRLLRTVPSLADLAIQPLAALVDCLEVQAFSAGHAIARSGERSHGLTNNVISV